ncbi:MAG: endonuclease III [Bacteroidaceae bacterium]|nr:endonuclease III [Bacteroidaceae bacterium]
MTLKERYAIVLSRLGAQFGLLDTELNYGTPFQLLIATVLSAQCTDKRVNIVTQRLFADYPDAQTMALADVETLFEYIKSVSYPNSKAKYLSGIARALVKEHRGEVPETMDELVKLPGVGRKTANVVLAFAFGQQALAVDTHVFRVSHRLGLVSQRCTTPLAVEKALLRHIPADQVAPSHSWFLLHGRYTCTAQRPKCAKCQLADVCKQQSKQQTA